VLAVHCTYDPATKGGNAADNKKVKGTIHWVNASTASPLEVRVYDYLFSKERPMEVEPRPDGTPGDFTDNLNPASLETAQAWGEPDLAGAAAPEQGGLYYQFERLGYFAADPDSLPGKIVFNKTIGLRDTWGKIVKKQ
jgi:glutaminyl-tRNA synthetase